MSDMIPFDFEDVLVRVIDQGGDPWFVLSDACKVLDITNSRNATARLDDDEKGVCIMDTLGGPQEMTIISESGLYALIFRSRKPQAVRFRKWVTSQVLPTIRKTGKYAVSGEPSPEQPLTEREQRLTKEVVNLQQRLLHAERHVAEFNEQIEICTTIKRMIITGLDDQTIAKAMDTTTAYVAHCRIRHTEQATA